MTRPSNPPTWDSNGTNMVATLSANLTDGYAADAIPTSGGENYWKRLVADWVAYFDATNAETQTINIPISAPGNSTPRGDVSITTGMVWSVEIPIQVGKKITAIRARCKDSATGPTILRANLVTVTDGSASASSLGTSTGSGSAQTLTVTGLTTTIVANTHYEIKFDFSSGAATCHLYNLEVDFKPY